MTQKEIKAHIEGNALRDSAAGFKDGNHLITVHLERSKMTLYYMIYIDGIFEGKWSKQESLIGQKYLLEHFVKPSKKYVEDLAYLNRLRGKALKAFIDDACQPRLIGYKPYGSAAAIAKKFASIKNLEIIQE